MDQRSASPRSRGFTLIELVVALGITAVLVILTTQAMIGVDRDQLLRTQVTLLQGDARLYLGFLEDELRQASLNAGTGTIWAGANGGGVPHPAIQIFTNLPGTGFLNVKPGTSALLIVEGLHSPRAAVVGALATSTVPIPVTSVSTTTPEQGTLSFAPGTPVLIGDYGDAAWGVLGATNPGANPPTLTLQDAVNNVFPGTQVKGVAAGASVRAAQSRLYFVDVSDELVRVTLLVPRAPASQAEVLGAEVLATGFENMQLDCQLDAGGSFGACPAAMAVTQGLSTESAAAFGPLTAGSGPVLLASQAPSLRTVIVNVVVRSRSRVNNGQGDPKISLPAGTPPLPVGGASDTDEYARRAYQLVAGVRNTSLGAL